MPPPLDLMRQRFGRLVVVDRAPSRGRGRRWTCRCDCGGSTEATTNDLRNGHTQSCGCTRRLASQRRVIDLTGRRFGRLLVSERATENSRHGFTRWVCRCDCGRETVVVGQELRNGDTKSCGCLAQEILPKAAWKHGGVKRPEYWIWAGMKDRCYNQNSTAYRNYGGRGITVCDEWREDFTKFYADMGPRPSPRHSIERVDNHGPYSPANCMWATSREQARNTRRAYRILHDGKELTLNEFCALNGLPSTLGSSRLYYGWPLIDAVYTPRGARRPREWKEDGE